MAIKSKQLDMLVGQAQWSTNLQLSAGTTQTVSSFFTGKVSGGSDTTAGVLASSPNNKVFLRVAGSGQPVKDLNSKSSVFARLTEVNGVWTLNYYTLQNGVEVAFDTTGNEAVGQNINFRWCEVVQVANAKPTAIVNAGEGIDEYDASSPASHQHIVQSVTVATNGQTAITLTQTPKDSADIVVKVNGLSYDNGVSYSISGTTLTWLNIPFLLETTDSVVIEYAYAG